MEKLCAEPGEYAGDIHTPATFIIAIYRNVLTYSRWPKRGDKSMLYRKGTGILTVSLILAGLFILVPSGCDRRERAVAVKLEKREALPAGKALVLEKPLRIAVGAMITPRAGFAYYRRLLDYIGENLGRPAQFVSKDKYEEVNALLKKGELDIAFVCSGPYVTGHDEFGLELLVAPQAYGKTVYYSYIIVRSDSLLKSFDDLRGKTFAFSDPDSNSGKLVPTYMLARMKETPDTFFKKYVFTYGHDKSIKAVAERLVDGAAVDSLIWDYLDKTDPEYTSQTKIILKSSPYGIPPVVVRPGLDVKMKERLKNIFLNIHKDEAGREILKGMMIDRFVSVNDASYGSVREMQVWTAGTKGTAGKQK
jgi:phosphonate transport system substrate-binding protein